MKKLIFTAAILAFTFGAQAQDRNAVKAAPATEKQTTSPATEPQEKKSEGSPAAQDPAKESLKRRSKAVKAEKQAGESEQPQENKAARKEASASPSSKPQNDAKAPKTNGEAQPAIREGKNNTGGAGTAPAQESIMMPDGTAAPATGGKETPAGKAEGQPDSKAGKNTGAAQQEKSNAPAGSRPAQKKATESK